MTNAELIEKIRAEIDKRYAEYRAKMKTDDFTYYEGMADALDLFEQFLDTIEESEVLPGFENEPKGIPGKDFVPVDWVETLEEYGIWKIVKVEEGCVWTIDKVRYDRNEEPVCEELEDAALEIARMETPDGAKYTSFPLYVAFKSGGKLMRKQMMKDGLDAVKSCQFDKIEKTIAGVFVKYGMDMQKQDMLKEAVSVEVVGDKRDLRLIDSTQRCLFNAKRGDWFKIIIVKEDEK